jgi:hypothetical protein
MSYIDCNFYLYLSPRKDLNKQSSQRIWEEYLWLVFLLQIAPDTQKIGEIKGNIDDKQPVNWPDFCL